MRRRVSERDREAVSNEPTTDLRETIWLLGGQGRHNGRLRRRLAREESILRAGQRHEADQRTRRGQVRQNSPRRGIPDAATPARRAPDRRRPPAPCATSCVPSGTMRRGL